MKKIILSFGAYILLASFSVHPGNTNLSEKATANLHVKSGRGYSAQLSGMEQPGSREPHGSGRAFIKFSPGQNEMYFYLEVHNIDPATTAFIHYGPAGATGPEVVELHAPVNGRSYATIQVSKEVIKAIMANPENYYVCVSNAVNPEGAVRGQLYN